MEMYFGYFGALGIGLILGLTGSGGSILAVPILVYLMHLNVLTATAYSLFVVGVTSGFGTIQNIQKGVVDVRSALYFAVPSFIAVFLTRHFLVPAIPAVVFENEHILLTRDVLLMVLFAVLMLGAALSMLKGSANENTTSNGRSRLRASLLIAAVGVLIGLVGAGGGFLIIPALILMAGLPVRKAMGTSLLIITLNSLIGFTGDIGNLSIDWAFLLWFTAIAVAGIFIGIFLSKFANEKQLRKGFGWFVLAMALFIISKEIFIKL